MLNHNIYTEKKKNAIKVQKNAMLLSADTAPHFLLLNNLLLFILRNHQVFFYRLKQ